MPSQRTKDVIRQRRRVHDDGDDEGSIITEAIDDSQSEASLPTDADDDADADYSDLSEADTHPVPVVAPQPTDATSISSTHPPRPSSPSPQEQQFETTRDTEAMLNGITTAPAPADVDALDFDALRLATPDASAAPTTANKPETISDKRRREHDEYKKKRDSDPAFIPTRGAFFMHDQRTSSPGANNFRGFGRGRGRGRNGPAGPFAPIV